MANINTVTGPIDTDDLGFTLMHEHILAANWSFRMAFPNRFDRDALIKRTVEKVKAAKAAGVDTLVDLTPINLGRDILFIREVAEKAEMQIIAATGLYWTEELGLDQWEIDEMVKLMLPEITGGISGTKAKAGIIKIASDKYGVNEYNEKILRVASRLQKLSGVPLSTHHDVNLAIGPKQLDVFESEDVDFSRVIIGHSGDSTDIDYLESMLKQGCYLGLDRFGLDMLLPTADRVQIIIKLCEKGWSKQLVVSHDSCCCLEFILPPQDLAEALPNWHYLHITNDVLPALKAGGISDEQIHDMTVGNPRRIFAGEAIPI